MQNIILEGKEVEGIVFDLGDLAEHLGQLNDPRDNRGQEMSFKPRTVTGQ